MYGAGLLTATTALYTCFSLVTLHAQYQYRHILKVTEHKKHFDKYHIVSYHEIMEEMVGKKMKSFSLTVVCSISRTCNFTDHCNRVKHVSVFNNMFVILLAC